MCQNLLIFPTNTRGAAWWKKLILPLFVFAGVFVPSVFGQGRAPNIVVILADDLGYGDIGFNGCPDIPTPNIDSLAANGVLCTSGYATHPFCSPSRAGLLTGRYQQRYGHENNLIDDESNPRLGLPSEELLLPQLLKPAGYVCGAIGKWHLGAALNFHPLQRGFDEFFGFLDGSSIYLNATVLRGETPVIEPEYLTDAFTREAESFINRYATQPFFLYLAYNAPHAPFQATEAYLDRVAYIIDPGRRNYAAMIVALDDGVGGVLAALQAQNILDDTLIFFLSDNGAPSQPFTRNDPLRGYKGNTLEGGIRVPFAVQWTGRLPGQIVYDTPVSALDIVASAAAVARIIRQDDREYDGLNIIPYLAGEQIMPARTLFWRWSGLGEKGPPGSHTTISAVRNGPLKLVTESETVGAPPALYNLSADLGETEDLAESQPEDLDSLKQLYNQWTLKTVPPLWQAPTDFLGGFPPSLVLAGDWNGFNKDDATAPWTLPRISAPGQEPTPDGFNWFVTTVHVAATGGDTEAGAHSFAVIGGNSYRNQWGGATIKIDRATSMAFYSGATLGPTNSISLEDGFYYSFRILDPIDEVVPSLTLSVMKTSAPPVSISRTGQVPSNPTSEEPVVVSIAASQDTCGEEGIYLRWTDDNFLTSHLVKASGLGMDYSATIPAQPAGTLVRYSIITSTADFDSVFPSGMIDPLILSSTGPFTVLISASASIPPSITSQPADATVAVGTAATFSAAAAGTDPLSYQWTKDGVTIVGATEATYTTPPETLADDGALFALVVTNIAGSVTSDDALVTVKPAPRPPSFTTQPADVTVPVGHRAKFVVKAIGTAPLGCQWMKNGAAIDGAIRPFYTTPSVTLLDNRSVFAVIVTNRAGSVTSSDATLTVDE